MLYQVLGRMIDRGDTEGMQEKLDVLFAFGRITETEYQALAARL